MDYFLTTYRKDYKWPVALSAADIKKAENDIKMRELKLKDADPHKMELMKPMVQSDVQPGTVIPAQSGAPPQGEASKYDQPNAYLQKLYRKYPYLYNIMKFTTTDDMAKRIMSEKYKSTYQVEYSREDDFSTLMDVVKHGEKPNKVPEEAGEPNVCLPEGIPAPTCKCAKGLAFSPCQCAKEVPVRRIAWKPAPISKIPQIPREKKKKSKDKENEDKDKPKTSGKGSSTPLKPFSTEYNETISKIGWLIVKNKLLHKATIEATQEEGKKKTHLKEK
ncbi:uncharacterized protein [Halyomorpha halys]|uniref:uncharacterized protein n=1 Tax=Halyomorpha halys TaxID=286706 RepID=UPI0006D5130C|nr:uncharacterized protein LOC106677766 [Halyomorpha halys]